MKNLRAFFVNLLQNHPGTLITGVLFVIALFTFGSYGMGWDEVYQREIGMTSWDYIFSNDSKLYTFAMRDYGVGFELPLIFIEKVFQMESEHSIFLMRHFVSHLFFLTGAFFCYRLIDLIYQNKLLASIGLLIFALHPVIYAHSFFNTKDVPFLSLSMICFYLVVRVLKQKTVLNVVWLALGMGFLINIRIMGVLLLCCVLLLFLVDAIREKKILFHLKLVLLFLGLTVVVIWISWPYLWEDPIRNFITSFKNMSKFRWTGSNLFKGNMIIATEIGWDYIPTWFVISTPIPFLLMGAAGILISLIGFVRRPLVFINDPEKRYNLVFLICFFVPLIAVIVLHSVLYDSWRHLFFIYAPFVMLAVYGIKRVFDRFRKWLPVAAFCAFLPLIIFMLQTAPLQHVYFNALVTTNTPPEYLRKNYEMDYWGTSFKQAMEYVLENDPSPELSIFVETDIPAFNNLKLLTADQQRRIHLVPKENARYFITNYRTHPEDYPFKKNSLHAIRVSDNTVVEIFKLK